ncbi:MAG: hypothetical protein H6Q20_2356 [Bacteroidetes bacterium]|jgi:hypothetical protein|nr:hypothetical protein [Bacteroidota bacterium]
MKTKRFILFAATILLTLPFALGQSTDIPSDIFTALNNGDAGKLSAYLNNNVELVIGNKNDVYSKQQASGIISDFFRQNKVTSFQLLHKGNKDAAGFAIGELKTSTGTYRVYVLTRKAGNQPVIQQLRIESSNE